jgi:hypothetical protein
MADVLEQHLKMQIDTDNSQYETFKKNLLGFLTKAAQVVSLGSGQKYVEVRLTGFQIGEESHEPSS